MVSYDAAGHRAQIINYDIDKTENNQAEVYSYDASGRRIESIIRHGPTITKKIYRYHDAENKIETCEEVITGERTINRKYISVFDNEGHQIEASYSDDSGIEISAFYRYAYNDKARVTTIETFNGTGSLYHRIAFDYDASGRLTKKACYGPNNTIYEQRVFDYGLVEKKEERLIYKDDSKLARKVIYRYDKKGNLIEVAGYDSNGSALGRTSHSFRFDDTGNWIKKITQSWNVKIGQPTAQWVEYQRITYW